MDIERQSTPLAMDAVKSRKASPSSVPSAIDRILTKTLLKISGIPRVEIQLWDGSVFSAGEEPPIAVMRFKNRVAFMKTLASREIGFGDGYSDGHIEVEGDLLDFLCEIYLATKHAVSEKRWLAKPVALLGQKKAKDNTLRGSKSNIYHHYDLGNDFYSLWLDKEAMQYTCAYFPRKDLSIEQAQIAKMEHICRKLMLRPGQTVVEAGCGWGGLALYMAKNYGVKVRSYNISHEQIVYATERAKSNGVQDQVVYIEDDYRNIKGAYDVFVSVGMLEHVGKQNYSELGSVVDRCLTVNGRGLIHSIGRNVPNLMSAWIEKRIFPGAYAPTIREIMDIVEPYDFSVLDVENLRLHYVETLRHWLDRFNENEEVVEKMFDERFVRAWRLYLTGSIGAFQVGSLQLFQLVFARGVDNSVAMTREHLYPTVDR